MRIVYNKLMGLYHMAQFDQSSDNEKHITFKISTTISISYHLRSGETLVDFSYLCFLRYKVGIKRIMELVRGINKKNIYSMSLDA
jgi:hypothetical protein